MEGKKQQQPIIVHFMLLVQKHHSEHCDGRIFQRVI